MRVCVCACACVLSEVGVRQSPPCCARRGSVAGRGGAWQRVARTTVVVSACSESSCGAPGQGEGGGWGEGEG